MDRIVIVTGGTKGIGFATAKKFLSCKDKVIILGRHECEDAVKELQKEGEVTFMKADVSAQKGGGKLIVPQGVWFTGPIVLKSNINLHLENRLT